MKPIRLIVLDPGHFHAALVQKEMYPELSQQVSVYAPLGGEVLDYLTRITAFNTRRENPTAWQVELHSGPDFFERMLREHPGNVVILTGRNRPKMTRIKASVDEGLNVLADKPWIITSGDLPALSQVLDTAQNRKLVAYDIMTERYEITSILQRELVNDPAVFGRLEAGSEAEPSIRASSVHNLMKVVAGIPLRRPAWFFDTAEYGEGLADVGTHVVDLVQWTAFPTQITDYSKDIRFVSAKHWPTLISKTQFQQVTGEADFPRELEANVKSGQLEYFCNNSVDYAVKGVHVRLAVTWNWEAPAGSGDSYEASFRGSKARVEIRQGKQEKFVPELYVVPVSGALRTEVFNGLARKLQALSSQYPGLSLEERSGEARIVIPERFRVGHEAHFGQVTRQFFEYLKSPDTMPEWEKANMLVKYYITTRGVELAQKSSQQADTAKK